MNSSDERAMPPPSEAALSNLFAAPRQAIARLAVPIGAAYALSAAHQLVNALWVAGLGADALAAIGMVAPFSLLLGALTSGLSSGGGAVISRSIGTGKRDAASAVASNLVLLVPLIALGISIPLLLGSAPIFSLMRAGPVHGLATSYGRILFAGFGFMLLSGVLMAILRSEGDAKGAMRIAALGVGLNVVLDPLLIYAADLGVAGAAAATVFSHACASATAFYRFTRVKNTHVQLSVKLRTLNWPVLSDILRLGVPMALSEVSLALMILGNTVLASTVAGPGGVAIYSAGYRFLIIAFLPATAIAGAVIALASVAVGARDQRQLNAVVRQALLLALGIESVIALLVSAGAPWIASLFARAEGAQHLLTELTTLFRIMGLICPITAIAILCGATFAAIKRPRLALLVSLCRAVLFTVPPAALLSLGLGYGLRGIWIGILFGNAATALLALGLLRRVLPRAIALPSTAAVHATASEDSARSACARSDRTLG
jgi:putative MATE family efflux protein